MKPDKALATALAGALAYVVVVGAISSSRQAEPVSGYELVHMRVMMRDSDHTVEIEDPRTLSLLGMWLDRAFTQPRSLFDMRVFSPPTNELEITFASGDKTLIYFSGGSRRPPTQPAVEGAMPGRESDQVVLQYDGEYYIADELPHFLLGEDVG
jgi:hypothetical protein